MASVDRLSVAHPAVRVVSSTTNWDRMTGHSGARLFSRPYADYVYGRGQRYLGAVCRGGHVVDNFVVDPDIRRAYSPSFRTDHEVDAFCARCGAPVLFRCPSCDAPFAGHRGGLGPRSPDQFCRSCGSPFPWTSRESMTARLRDLLAHEPLDDHERLQAQEALDTLAGPDDDLDEAAKRKALDKLKRSASETWWKVAAPVLASLLSAELRRQMGLPPG